MAECFAMFRALITQILNKYLRLQMQAIQHQGLERAQLVPGGVPARELWPQAGEQPLPGKPATANVAGHANVFPDADAATAQGVLNVNAKDSETENEGWVFSPTSQQPAVAENPWRQG